MPWQTAAPSDPNPSLVRDRMFSQLLEAERAAKQDALTLVDGFRKVLFQIAQQMDGESVQSMQRAAPGVFQVYSPAQWFLFFDAALRRKPARQVGSSGPASADEERVQALTAELAGVREQLEREQRQTRDLRAALEDARRDLQSARQERERAGGDKQRRDARSKGKTIPTKANPAVTAATSVQKSGDGKPAPAVSLQAAAAFANWRMPTCPARFERHLSEDPDRYRRQCKSLYLLSAYGYGSRLESDYLVGMSEGLASRSGSLRGAIDELAERGLAVEQALTVETEGFKTSLTVHRLSKEGRELCGLFGWQVIESEWERLIRMHEGERFPQHTLGVLAFALHARVRGWQAQVLPEVQGHAAPDVRIEKGEESFYVEVEMGDRRKDDKWRTLAAMQGRVALCAATIAQRQQLATDCRRMKLSGLATDLQSLVQQRLPIEKPEVFWEETW